MSDLLNKFETEYNKWREETSFHSRLEPYFVNEHFKNIVAMGLEVTPFIINKIKERPNFIVYALDLLYPNLMEYTGYVPLEDVCKIWVITYESYLKKVFEENEIISNS